LLFPFLLFRSSAPYSSHIYVGPLTRKWRCLSGKGRSRRFMFSIPKNVNVEELRRLAESDVPVLAFAFKRRAAEDWAPEHSHARGQFFALTRGLMIVEAGNERWMFPSQRCAWIPPHCLHKARSVGGVAGSMVFLSPEMCRGLPKKPCLFSSSGLLFSIVDRVLEWNPRQPLDPPRKRLITVLRDEIAQPEQQALCLPLPRDDRLEGLHVLCWMMSPTTAGWTTGRILLVCPAALSCVRFPLRWVCRLAVGDSRHGCSLRLKCLPRANL
jgi:AraC-like protein